MLVAAMTWSIWEMTFALRRRSSVATAMTFSLADERTTPFTARPATIGYQVSTATTCSMAATATTFSSAAWELTRLSAAAGRTAYFNKSSAPAFYVSGLHSLKRGQNHFQGAAVVQPVGEEVGIEREDLPPAAKVG